MSGLEQQGLHWNIQKALLHQAAEFQNDEGQPMYMLKLAYLGGMSTLMVDPATYKKCAGYQGKTVSASGALFIEIKKNGAVKVSMSVDSMAEAK